LGFWVEGLGGLSLRFLEIHAVNQDMGSKNKGSWIRAKLPANPKTLNPKPETSNPKPHNPTSLSYNPLLIKFHSCFETFYSRLLLRWAALSGPVCPIKILNGSREAKGIPELCCTNIMK